MQVLKFQSIDTKDRIDMRGEWWSRIYEYPLILDLLDKYGATTNSNIHNTCWGFEDMHIWFKNTLDKKYPNNINSDINPSPQPNTYVYDLTTPPKKEWVENFEFVINVSTLEEIKSDHIGVFEKSFSMVKKGGYFLSTFDLPGLQLNKFEDFFNTKYKLTSNPINGLNSKWVSTRYESLSCGYMVIKK